MTPQDKARLTNWLGIPAALATTAVIIAWLLSAAFVTREQHDDDLDQIKHTQEAINAEILRKLDCALWNLPLNCRDTMSPRGP